MAKLKPMKVERDQYGCWIHPVYNETWNELFEDCERLNTEHAKLLNDTLGVYFKYTKLGDDPKISYEEWERMHEECDLSNWKPKLPKGYFEVGYWFTEDDAVAVFAKEK